MHEIVIENVTHDYDEIRALNNIILTIEPGKIYGLLGPKGAGKTTLLNLITAKMAPTKGEIRLNGRSVWENALAQSQIYHLTEEDFFPPKLRVTQIFRWTQSFYPRFDLDYAYNLAEKFVLDVTSRYKDLALGFKTICKAITALATNAPILILDEPIANLHTPQRKFLYEEIWRNYKENPKTIIFSAAKVGKMAHILQEIIIIKDGKVLCQRSVSFLLEQAYTVSGERSKVDQYIRGRKYLGSQIKGNLRSVTVLGSAKDEALATELNLDFGRPELEEVYKGLTEEVET